MSGRGLYYEDFTIGQVFTTGRRTITETDVVFYAYLSGDMNPLHTDEVFAKSGPFGRRVAHGPLGLAIANGLVVQTGTFDGTGVAALGLTWKFVKPIFFGDSIFVRMTIVEARTTRNPARGIIRRTLDVINQDNVVVQQGEAVTMLLRKPKEPTLGGSSK
jgi:acyl dehydratase